MSRVSMSSGLLPRLIAEARGEIMDLGVKESIASEALEWVLVRWHEWAEVDKRLGEIDELLSHLGDGASDAEVEQCRQLLIEVVGPLCSGWPEKKSDQTEWKESRTVGLNHRFVRSEPYVLDCQLENAIERERKAEEAVVRPKITRKMRKLRRVDRRLYAVLLGAFSDVSQSELSRTLATSNSTISRDSKKAMLWFEKTRERAQILLRSVSPIDTSAVFEIEEANAEMAA